MPLSDIEIKGLVRSMDMITDFVEESVEEGVVSYGLTSSGYDIRIGNKFKVYHNVGLTNRFGRRVIEKGLIPKFHFMDPKNNHPELVEDVFVPDGYALVLQPGDYALGSSIERFRIPRWISSDLLGKSTYARKSIVTNFTPLESEWEGHVTVELFAACQIPAVIYCGEGIAQVRFHHITGPVERSYKDKKGKYNYQADEPVEARIK